MKRTTKRAVIALDLQHLTVPGLVLFTRAIGKGLTNNTNFTTVDIGKLPFAVADMLTAATTLETTHTGRLTTPSRAATKLEGDQATSLMGQLTDTARFVEGLANTKAAGDLALAQSIIASVGFPLKKAGVKRAKGFEAESTVKGTVDVHVPAGENNEVSLLRFSADGGKTWSATIVVHGVDITLTNLTSGVDYLFEKALSIPPAKRGKQVATAGSEAPAWGDAISCVIS
jgi:hypothetical protein